MKSNSGAKFGVDEVKAFISKIKNPDKLIRGCEKFHRMEPRDITYLVSQRIISENPESDFHILAGIKVLLLTWNAVYIQRREKKVKEKLEGDVMRALAKTKNDFEFLKDRKLETIDLKDQGTVARIRRIFKAFANYESIATTGASKAIHLIFPDLFMMWDNRIRRNYHKLHPSYRRRSETPEECYIEYLRTMQEVAKSVLEKKSMNEIWKMYREDIYYKEPELGGMFPRGATESLTKMLDECNFMKFTKETSF